MAYSGSSAQQRRQCSTRISACAVVGRGSLKNRQWRVLVLGFSQGMNGVTLPIVTLGTTRPEDSGAAGNATEFQH